MAKNNRSDRNPRAAARPEDEAHPGTPHHHAAGGMSAHAMEHGDPDHEHGATATMQQKKQQQQHEGASPTTMKSKKGNQPRNNQPKR